MSFSFDSSGVRAAPIDDGNCRCLLIAWLGSRRTNVASVHRLTAIERIETNPPYRIRQHHDDTSGWAGSTKSV
ncbi:MAG: hypothetical protein MPJ50_05550 [Pirellulales bacterium]|nr:hypothetical protein [Pirellulales bacterium]